MISKDLQNLYSVLNLSKLPKDIKISTITITCKVDTTFNTKNIENFLDLDDDIITIKSIDTNKSLLITKKRRRTKTKKTKKNAFYNQVSIGIKKQNADVKKSIINTKLFINGAIQITGCKSSADFVYVMTTLFKKMSIVKAVYDDRINKIVDRPFVDDYDALDIERLKNIKIAMINSNFNIGFSIDREKLYRLLIHKNVRCSYDPIIHACVNIKYEFDYKKKISIFVFEKGTVIITGVNNCEQIQSAYDFIYSFLKKNYSYVSKTSAETNDCDILNILRKCNININDC